MPSSELEDLLAATRGGPRPGIVEKHLDSLSEDDRELISTYVDAALEEELPFHAISKVLIRRFAFPCAIGTITKWLNGRKQADRP